MYKQGLEKIKYPETEQNILKFWKENKIFEKSVESRSPDPGRSSVWAWPDLPPVSKTPVPPAGCDAASPFRSDVPGRPSGPVGPYQPDPRHTLLAEYIRTGPAGLM